MARKHPTLLSPGSLSVKYGDWMLISCFLASAIFSLADASKHAGGQLPSLPWSLVSWRSSILLEWLGLSFSLCALSSIASLFADGDASSSASLYTVAESNLGQSFG